MVNRICLPCHKCRTQPALEGVGEFLLQAGGEACNLRVSRGLSDALGLQEHAKDLSDPELSGLNDAYYGRDVHIFRRPKAHRPWRFVTTQNCSGLGRLRPCVHSYTLHSYPAPVKIGGRNIREAVFRLNLKQLPFLQTTRGLGCGGRSTS